MAAGIRKITNFSEVLHPGCITPKGSKICSKSLYLYSTQRVQHLLELTLSLTVLEIIDIFHFQRNSRWAPEFGKVKIFQRHFYRIFKNQRVQNLLKITLAPMVFNRAGTSA